MNVDKLPNIDLHKAQDMSIHTYVSSKYFAPWRDNRISSVIG